MKPLNTGVYANIPNSFVDANPTCKIFQLQSSSTNKYECAAGCLYNDMMLLISGGYVCPDSLNAPYYDKRCATYTTNEKTTYECSGCKDTYSLVFVQISNQ